MFLYISRKHLKSSKPAMWLRRSWWSNIVSCLSWDEEGSLFEICNCIWWYWCFFLSRIRNDTILYGSKKAPLNNIHLHPMEYGYEDDDTGLLCPVITTGILPDVFFLFVYARNVHKNVHKTIHVCAVVFSYLVVSIVNVDLFVVIHFNIPENWHIINFSIPIHSVRSGAILSLICLIFWREWL